MLEIVWLDILLLRQKHRHLLTLGHLHLWRERHRTVSRQDFIKVVNIGILFVCHSIMMLFCALTVASDITNQGPVLVRHGED